MKEIKSGLVLLNVKGNINVVLCVDCEKCTLFSITKKGYVTTTRAKWYVEEKLGKTWKVIAQYPTWLDAMNGKEFMFYLKGEKQNGFI